MAVRIHIAKHKVSHPPEACENALVPKVGPRDCWKSDMIHDRQRQEEAEVGAAGETYTLEGTEPQTPRAKKKTLVTT